jgi:hypothetical protein
MSPTLKPCNYTDGAEPCGARLEGAVGEAPPALPPVATTSPGHRRRSHRMKNLMAHANQ